MLRKSSMVLSFALLAVPGASAQPIDQRLAERSMVGTVVTVTDEAGKTTSGRVQHVSEEALSLARRGGIESIPMHKVVRIEKPDRLVNGALIGMTIGIAAGIIGGNMDPQGNHNRSAFVAVSTLGNAVIWTALGTAVDAMFDNKRTLYERGGGADAFFSPILGPGIKGAALSVSW